MSITIVIPKENESSERRVAITPAIAKRLHELGATLRIEPTAGNNAGYSDAQYTEVTWASGTKIFEQADLILKINPPTLEEIKHYKPGAVLIGLLAPHLYPDRIEALRQQKITSFSLEKIPRTTRAQAMDVLSSQATVAGYKAVLLAANAAPRFFSMLTTAAGTIKPAHVLVIGAGVAGLQAIATAKRLGAIVSGYDIRPAAKEQIESLGAKAIAVPITAEGTGGYARELTPDEQRAQQDELAKHIAKSDVVICTAAIPGKTAPKIITQAMVESMLPGSVIVDIAAESGGNCILTQADQTINFQGIQILGPTRLASLVPRDASDMYARNIFNFLQLIIHDKQIQIPWQDEIIAKSALTHNGEIFT